MIIGLLAVFPLHERKADGIHLYPKNRIDPTPLRILDRVPLLSLKLKEQDLIASPNKNVPASARRFRVGTDRCEEFFFVGGKGGRCDSVGHTDPVLHAIGIVLTDEQRLVIRKSMVEARPDIGTTATELIQAIERATKDPHPPEQAPEAERKDNA